MNKTIVRVEWEDPELETAVEWFRKWSHEYGVETATACGHEEKHAYPVRLVSGNTHNANDSFEITMDSEKACINGNRLRAVIYGINEFLFRYKTLLKENKTRASSEKKVHQAKENTKTFKPLFPYRSVWASAKYGEEWVEHGIHNRINSIALSDIIGILKGDEKVINIIRKAEKHDLDITVGGHVISSLVDIKELALDNPDFCALINGGRTDKGQICYSNPGARSFLANTILDFSRTLSFVSKAINRLTIWPEDSAVTCQCESCSKKAFNEFYAEMIYEAARLMAGDGSGIRIEFILYNALLGKPRKEAFITLDPPSKIISDADCLVAYWGRDYSNDLGKPENEFDYSGRARIEKTADAVRQKGAVVNIYEYYIDLWQLGDLFPFLGPIIYKDMVYYHKIGINGFLFDIADCPSSNPQYPFQFLKLLNLSFAGRAMWDDAGEYNDYFASFCRSYFWRKSDAAREILTVLFEALAPLSWLNLRHPLPGLSGGNPWFLEMAHEIFVFDPDSDEQTRTAARHRELCANAQNRLSKIAGSAYEKKSLEKHFEMLTWYVDYVVGRLQSTRLYLEAQEDMRSGKTGWQDKVEKGLEIDDRLGWPARKYYNLWKNHFFSSKILHLSPNTDQNKLMSTLATTGGKPVRSKPFPSWPVIDSKESNAVNKVLKSGKWWYGEKVRAFEQQYAAFHNAKHGVSCANGTVALEIGLLACGIGAGDEVIVPPYTFVATASAVLRVNAIPIFADIELDTCNLDPREVERKITKRTKAIMPVHFGGLPVDLDAFKALARKHNLRLIEDACHSWGSQWKNKGTGAIGDCGAFSFQMSKNITSGEGGILLSDDEAVADAARSYSNCGRGKGKKFYEHFLLGSNLRMTELQAAILICQLSRLEKQVLKREENAKYLDSKLKDIPGISLIKGDSRVTRRSYHMYIFRFLKEKWDGVTREEFLKALNAEGIPSSSGYPIPLYKNPLFLKKGDGPKFCPISCPYYGEKIDYTRVHCPNTEKICEEACWIAHPALLAKRSDMQDVVHAIAKIWENRNQLKK